MVWCLVNAQAQLYLLPQFIMKRIIGGPIGWPIFMRSSYGVCEGKSKGEGEGKVDPILFSLN
jgi:hypothetical protein